jgi:hypothetical protein
MATALTVTQLFDSLAIRIDGKRVWDTTASIRWHFTDTGVAGGTPRRGRGAVHLGPMLGLGVVAGRQRV